MTNNALEKLRVLDLTTTYSGPTCTRLLADIGMEVIKIEAPGGEAIRGMFPLREDQSSTFGQLNIGKKSMVLSLRAAEGVAAFRKLVETADIVVENYRPGVMARFGLDFEALKAIKPDIVYCAISGYGQTGPSAGLAAYAPTIHAASGLDMAHMEAQPGRVTPDLTGIPQADFVSGIYAFGATMAALAVRDRTGEAQMIDLSMLEASLSLLVQNIQRAQFEMPPSTVSYGPTATSDGFIIVVPGTPRIFAGFCKVLGHEDWLTDPRFATSLARRANWADMIAVLTEWASDRTKEECKAAFDAEGVPCAIYRTVAEVMQDPQIAHRGAVVTVTDPAGPFLSLNPPFKFNGQRAQSGTRVAVLGEDTETLLTQAGLSPEQIHLASGADAAA